VGIVTRDIGIDIIQRQAERIKPYEGAVVAVYSNSGLIAGHFDTGRLGRTMSETDNAAVHRVNKISSQNKENTNVLLQEVSHFKVE
jgi:hypothetical protein